MHWERLPIARIEDLSDAVRGAGLTTVQMSRPPLIGSLAFAAEDGIAYSTGQIGGQVALSGSLSESLVTLGLGLSLPPGSRQWLIDVATGNMGIFLPGDSHDALYMPGSLYATATLSFELLEEQAAKLDLVLTRKEIKGSGVINRPLSAGLLHEIKSDFENIHNSTKPDQLNFPETGRKLLQAFISHLGREPRPVLRGTSPRGHASTVAKARAFILENLDRPLSLATIASAISTSQRTLHRAFLNVLNETPYSYVQKMRLHRIRSELISDAEKTYTIKIAVNRWGITELGRFSGWYNDLFGELPSETIARRNRGFT